MGSVPEYYVALELTGDGECCRPGLLYAPRTRAVVRVTATGAALATIVPPQPYGTFTGVTTAADNRTFVLAAQVLARLPLRSPPATRFFQLRLDPAARPAGGRARLGPLPIAEQPTGIAVSGLALSPDATRLAVTAGPMLAPILHVFTLATGADRAWSETGIGPGLGPGATRGSLSWAADGQTLALLAGSGVRLLDTTAPGPSLLANSHPVLATPESPYPYWRQVMITPDGQALVVVIQVAELDARGHLADVTQQLLIFSASTGELLRTLNHLPVHRGYQHVLWVGRSGQDLIVSGTQPGATVGTFNLGPTAGVLSHGRFTPIPWSNRAFAAAW